MIFGPVPFIGGNLQLRFFDDAVSTTSTITVPNGVRAGYVIVLLDFAWISGGIAPSTVPSGFTAAVNTTGIVNQYRAIVSYKIADGTEGGTSLSGINTANTSKILIVFSASRPVTSVTVGDPDGQSAEGDPTAQTLAASGGTAPLIALGAYSLANNPAAISPRTFTIGGNDAKDDEINSPNPDALIDLWLAYKIMNRETQLADITVDMDDEGTLNILQSVYLECSAV